jgi:hypothetical protein
MRMTDAPPFTYRFYRAMLEAARDGGHAVTSFARFDAKRPRTLILRHDVDYTLDGVLRFAELEAELGCTATYLFRVHAEYNPFSPLCLHTMRRVEVLGHEVGLHFECMNVGRALRLEPIDLLRREKLVLETILGHSVRTCSEHREMSGGVHGTPVFTDAQMIADLGFEFFAMAPRWCKDMKYLSDSNAVWREGDPTQHLGKHDRLQVLVHADWWFEEDLLLKGPYFHGTQA